MIQDTKSEYNKDVLRQLRLRMGWSASDLARRLQCSLADIKMWEEGYSQIDSKLVHEIEILLRQADSCQQEIRFMPIAENHCDQQALDQIEFDRVKAELE